MMKKKSILILSYLLNLAIILITRLFAVPTHLSGKLESRQANKLREVN